MDKGVKLVLTTKAYMDNVVPNWNNEKSVRFMSIIDVVTRH